MGKLLDLDQLKQEYIGKTFGWLTIIDVKRVLYNNRSKLYFVCMCRCGAIKDISKDKVLSGHTKSCGCYNTSEEKIEKYIEWCKNNPDKLKEKSDRRKKTYLENPEIVQRAAKKHSEWYKNNPDKTKEIGLRHSLFYKDNPDIGIAAGKKVSQWYKDNSNKVKEKGKNHSIYLRNNSEAALSRIEKYIEWCKNNPDKVKGRAIKSSLWHEDINKHNIAINKLLNTYRQKRIKNTDFTILQDIVSADTFDKLCAGDYDSHSIINVRCPLCGNYSQHMLKNFYNLSRGKLKYDKVPYCSLCKYSLLSSKYEDEIADYISTFYSGELIRNSRDIISPLELDLYYSEKKIAIEFNGDYWHSDEFKEKDYHYNKFIKCKENGILLVSIFESEWNNRKDEIKEYIKDLFNGKENKLSFNEDYSLMNNNYPLPNINIINEIIEHYYKFNDYKVFTCGYTKI